MKKVAAEQKNRDSRNTGRKKFSPADVDTMKKLLAEGGTVQQVAERFDASRSTVFRYLNPKPKKGCTLRMTYMYGRRPCTVIDVDFLHQKVYIQNRTDDLLHRAFGVGGGSQLGGLPGVSEKPLFPAHSRKYQDGTAGAGPH